MPRTSRLTVVLFVLWIVNFISYVVVSMRLGGDAINGHVAAGHYFLGSHGHSTEVSSGVFQFSRWYTYLLWAHLIAVLVAVGVQQRRRATDR